MNRPVGASAARTPGIPPNSIAASVILSIIFSDFTCEVMANGVPNLIVNFKAKHMSHIHSQPLSISSQADWRGPALRPSDWRYELTAGEVDEINSALEILRATGKTLIEMS